VAPASLAGYAATLKPSVGKQELVVSWGDDTWAQAGTDSDTNADDYCAGTYTYIQTGPHTAVLTNMDIGMFSWLGTTNVTTVDLTFTSDTGGKYAWTNENGSGSGTMTFSRVSNLVPASLAGETVQVYKSNGALETSITFAGGGTFTQTNAGADYFGTYSFSQYSPAAAIVQLKHTDPDDYGAVEYWEFDFTTAAAGNGFGSYYPNPAYGRNPDSTGVGAFKLK
jgi:hypothetical protein